MARQLKLPAIDYVETLDATFARMASHCQEEKRLKILFLTFWADPFPPKLLRTSQRGVLSVARRKDYWLVDLRKTLNEGRAVHGKFGLFRNAENIWSAFTTEPLDFLHSVIVPLVRLHHPAFSRVYLTSRDMRAIFEELELVAQAKILARKAISYSHRKESNINYRKRPHWQIFDIAETEDEYVDKVEFTVQKEQGLHGFLSRDGICKFYAGDLRSLKTLLQAITNIALQKRSFFAERIRPQGSEKVFPIDLSFVEDVFRGTEDNIAFLAALSRLERSGLAIMHQNPYLHVSLVDFYDGSSFDIFATRNNAVTIIPQVSSSAFALNRLCNHIFEQFHEGSISEPAPASYSIEDFTR